MLFTTNLILLVGKNDFGDFSPRKITIYNTSSNATICSSWPFSENIHLAKINKKRMIVCEGNNMHIYTTGEMKILHTLEIGKILLPNIVLSANADKNNFLFYSSIDDEGIIKVYDLLSLSYKNAIKAHKSSINLLSLNTNGEKLASCSNKGTIIRVFSVPKGEKLFTFKRGIVSATIYSINFSYDSEMLVCSSDTGTIHLFNLKTSEM